MAPISKINNKFKNKRNNKIVEQKPNRISTRNYKSKSNLILADFKKENRRIAENSNLTLINNNIRTDGTDTNEKNVSEKDFLLKCEWTNCFDDLLTKEQLYDHASNHIVKLKHLQGKYICLWFKCSFATSCNNEIARHIHYHVYHTILMTQGKKAMKNSNIPNCTNTSQNVNTNIPEFGKDFICRWTDCNKKFISIILFYSHVRLHCDFEFESSKLPDKKKSIVSCGWEYCSKKFSVKYRLQEHILKHTNEKLIGCHVCGGIFRTKTIFIDHCKRQEANNTQEFQCGQCFKYFSSERLLRLHITLHVNCFKCSICDMTCNSSFTLASHIRYRHMKQKPYECSFCEQKYVTKNDLKRHILIMHEHHTYKCTQIGCNYAAKSTFSLKKHFAAVHNNQQIIYACHCCEMVYNRGATLSKHLIRIHSFQLPSGHKRFTYCIDENGIYRLQTKRIESLEVTKQILSPKPVVETEINLMNKSSDIFRNNNKTGHDFFSIENVEINIPNSYN